MRTLLTSATNSAWREQKRFSVEGRLIQRFVARQPILDRGKSTFGYELLFRSGWQNSFSGESEAASRRLIDDAVSFGLGSLVEDTVPFINCTHSILVQGLATLLPRGTALEVLETVEVDDVLITACKRLQAQGYRIALDDFDFTERWEPLLGLADFIKVDFRSSSPEQRKTLIGRLSRKPPIFLAEKIEDETEFRLAQDEGFHLFQGYFFTKPIVLARPNLASIMHRLRLWKELRKPELDNRQVLLLLKEEASLSLRLLRFANSAMTGARSEVTSLRTALAMMGVDQFRKMALVVLTSEICGNQPPEVYRTILQRARYCELMAFDTDQNPTDLYLFGMLSVLKSVLGLSSDDLQQLITLPKDLMEALACGENWYQSLLRAGIAFSEGDWETLARSASILHISETRVSRFCNEARFWADEVVESALLP